MVVAFDYNGWLAVFMFGLAMIPVTVFLYLHELLLAVGRRGLVLADDALDLGDLGGCERGTLRHARPYRAHDATRGTTPD